MTNTPFGGKDCNWTDYQSAKIVVLPIPYDYTATWQKGADQGAEAIIEASAYVELYDIETDSEVHLHGIHTFEPPHLPRSPEKLIHIVREHFSTFADDGKFPVMLGGNHSVTPGAVQGLKDHFVDLTVLQLDAHADLRESYHGSMFNHACVMARIEEICQTVQVGIRSMSREEFNRLDTARVFLARDIFLRSDWVEKVVKLLSANVYVTIDLDVFDPSTIPSTGTPEPGGLGWYQVVGLLKEVAENRNVVGFDVVELLPSKHNKAPDFIAAKLVFKFLSYIFKNR
ncbi:MAG: agmatinase [Deltaproteobacteria bacterium]|nr:MAG: agmatinase [Deltaproteobacteria bacterium]